MSDINSILNKLLKFYDLDTLSELSEVLKVSQPTISKWRARNTIIPIKKRCRELGIYNEIFGDSFNTFTQTGANSTQIQNQINNPIFIVPENINIRKVFFKNREIIKISAILFPLLLSVSFAISFGFEEIFLYFGLLLLPFLQIHH